ncbi:exported hypothetical protein [Paraburkholderia caribensis]|nr:exported hypothetical protein [Paraburkholderia caribensis]
MTPSSITPYNVTLLCANTGAANAAVAASAMTCFFIGRSPILVDVLSWRVFFNIFYSACLLIVKLLAVLFARTSGPGACNGRDAARAESRRLVEVRAGSNFVVKCPRMVHQFVGLSGF